jgi:hypothetical protein
MPRIRALLLCAAALAASSECRAQLFKCVGTDGRTSYQSEACPTTAKEQRLKEETRAGDSGDEIPEGIQPGWDKRELLFMADVCAKSILVPAQKEYDAASQPFPEKQLTPQVEKYCNCIARRASTTWTFAQYAKDPLGTSAQLANEALKGGPCKPEGLHAELLRKAGKMR